MLQIITQRTISSFQLGSQWQLMGEKESWGRNFSQLPKTTKAWLIVLSGRPSKREAWHRPQWSVYSFLELVMFLVQLLITWPGTRTCTLPLASETSLQLTIPVSQCSPLATSKMLLFRCTKMCNTMEKYHHFEPKGRFPRFAPEITSSTVVLNSQCVLFNSCSIKTRMW